MRCVIFLLTAVLTAGASAEEGPAMLRRARAAYATRATMSVVELARAIGRLDEHLFFLGSGRGSDAWLGDRCPFLLSSAVVTETRAFASDPTVLAALPLLRDLRLEMRERWRREPKAVRDVLLRFHRHEVDLRYDALDALLLVERIPTELALVDHSRFPGEQIYARSFFFDLASSEYETIRSFYELTTPGGGDLVYDLGSGFGRVLLYGAVLFPDARYRGIELVAERVAVATSAAAAIGLRHATFRAVNVVDADFSDGTIFYLYNPFPPRLPAVVERLRAISTRHAIRIGAHGLSSFRNHTWMRRDERHGLLFHAP